MADIFKSLFQRREVEIIVYDQYLLNYDTLIQKSRQQTNADQRQLCPQGHLCGRGEEIDDPGKGCPNLLVH